MSNYVPSWFDLLVVLVLAVGLLRGRKNGMSGELLPVLQALGIVVAGAYLYQPLGKALADVTPVFGLLFGFVAGYVLIAMGVKFVTDRIKHAAGEKLTGSDVFGGGEYYLGMFAGAVRFSCFIIMFLALANAREYTDSERASLDRAQQDNFGIVFPTMASVQQEIFSRSSVGQLVKQHFPSLLIEPTRPSNRPLRRPDTIGGQREGAVDAVIDPRPPPG